MSQNFSAEQFEDHYDPNKIGNWEVPRKFRKHPHTLEGFTQPITDENGRFLPDVPKPPLEEWSCFKGTWGQDRYSQPGVVQSTEIDPGMWVVEGGKGYWIKATPK